MLSVGIDLRGTEAGFKEHAIRGTGRYVSEVSSHMMNLSKDSEIAISPIYTSDIEQGLKIANALPFGRRTFESQWSLPRSIARFEYDLVHFFSHGDASGWSNLKQVVTVLDLIPLKLSLIHI